MLAADVAVVVCSCPEYLSAKKEIKKASVCKKCKGSRLPLATIGAGGTMRLANGAMLINNSNGHHQQQLNHHHHLHHQQQHQQHQQQQLHSFQHYQSHAFGQMVATPASNSRLPGGTVRVGNCKTRPSILLQSIAASSGSGKTSDPYDMMRRSRLVAPITASSAIVTGTTSRSRAKSSSPVRLRSSSQQQQQQQQQKQRLNSPTNRLKLEVEKKEEEELDDVYYDTVTINRSQPLRSRSVGRINNFIAGHSHHRQLAEDLWMVDSGHEEDTDSCGRSILQYDVNPYDFVLSSNDDEDGEDSGRDYAVNSLEGGGGSNSNDNQSGGKSMKRRGGNIEISADSDDVDLNLHSRKYENILNPLFHQRNNSGGHTTAIISGQRISMANASTGTATCCTSNAKHHQQQQKQQRYSNYPTPQQQKQQQEVPKQSPSTSEGNGMEGAPKPKHPQTNGRAERSVLLNRDDHLANDNGDDSPLRPPRKTGSPPHVATNSADNEQPDLPPGPESHQIQVIATKSNGIKSILKKYENVTFSPATTTTNASPVVGDNSRDCSNATSHHQQAEIMQRIQSSLEAARTAATAAKPIKGCGTNHGDSKRNGTTRKGASSGIAINGNSSNTVNGNGAKASQFYLPMPQRERKKVQFCDRNETFQDEASPDASDSEGVGGGEESDDNSDNRNDNRNNTNNDRRINNRQALNNNCGKPPGRNCDITKKNKVLSPNKSSPPLTETDPEAGIDVAGPKVEPSETPMTNAAALKDEEAAKQPVEESNCSEVTGRQPTGTRTTTTMLTSSDSSSRVNRGCRRGTEQGEGTLIGTR